MLYPIVDVKFYFIICYLTKNKFFQGYKRILPVEYTHINVLFQARNWPEIKLDSGQEHRIFELKISALLLNTFSRNYA